MGERVVWGYEQNGRAQETESMNEYGESEPTDQTRPIEGPVAAPAPRLRPGSPAPTWQRARASPSPTRRVVAARRVVGTRQHAAWARQRGLAFGSSPTAACVALPRTCSRPPQSTGLPTDPSLGVAAVLLVGGAAAGGGGLRLRPRSRRLFGLAASPPGDSGITAPGQARPRATRRQRAAAGGNGAATAETTATASPLAVAAAGRRRTSRRAMPRLTQQVGVVDINTKLKYQGRKAAGTGMILTSNGEILTNNHVIEGATKIKVIVVTTGKTYAATVVGTDKVDDIAVLQLTGAIRAFHDHAGQRRGHGR